MSTVNASAADSVTNQSHGISQETIDGLHSFGCRRVTQSTASCKVCTNVAFLQRPSDTATIGFHEPVWVGISPRQGKNYYSAVHRSCMVKALTQLGLTGCLPRRADASDTDLSGTWRAATLGPAHIVEKLLTPDCNVPEEDHSIGYTDALSITNSKPIVVPGCFWYVTDPEGVPFIWSDTQSNCSEMLHMLKESAVETSEPAAVQHASGPQHESISPLSSQVDDGPFHPRIYLREEQFVIRPPSWLSVDGTIGQTACSKPALVPVKSGHGDVDSNSRETGKPKPASRDEDDWIQLSLNWAEEDDPQAVSAGLAGLSVQDSK